MQRYFIRTTSLEFLEWRTRLHEGEGNARFTFSELKELEQKFNGRLEFIQEVEREGPEELVKIGPALARLSTPSSKRYFIQDTDDRWIESRDEARQLYFWGETA